MKRGFPPISNTDAHILILGSMPGEESLRQQQYYGHPRNAFWFIIESIFSDQHDMDYQQRLVLLKNNKIALWDVLMSCHRKGSLDTNIDSTSIRVNNFADFYQRHPLIETVFFNGAKAEQEYSRRVKKTLTIEARVIKYHRLPSTSPAMASLSKQDKLTIWSRSLNEYNHS